MWSEVLSAYKEPAQRGFSAVQHFDQRASYCLQAIRRKQEGKEQEHEPAQRCWCEKEANSEDCDNNRGNRNRQEEGTKVKEEPAQGGQQGEDKGKGSGDYFSISSS